MPETESFQLSVAAAEMYESKFVPALFAEWAPLVVDAAGVGGGDRVLDVACGTGVVAREAAARVGPGGQVVGVDINDAMLAVARRIAAGIEWRSADATDLPLPDGSFDAVLCQAALMFFPDRPAALREMARVLRDDGTVVVQVWASLGSQPAYEPFVAVAARHAGPEAVDLLSSYWVLGDLDQLEQLFTQSGLRLVTAKQHTGTARFGSIDELVKIEIESTPLVDRIDVDTYAAILADARLALARYETPGGGAQIPIVGHVLVARS